MPARPLQLLFDLDGTLTDSAPGILRGFEVALARFGQPCPPVTHLRFALGPPLRESLLQLLPEREHPRLEEYVAAYRDHFAEVGIFENEVYPGVVEALERLRGLGHRIRLATSKPQVYAERILRHFALDRYFDSTHGSALTGERSNKAELIAHLLRADRVAPEEAVMIGDREHDIRGGIRNGARTVGVLWGYGSEPELLGAGANAVCARPEELDAAIRSAFGR